MTEIPATPGPRLRPRHKPVQSRARQSAQEILEATAVLLEEIGIDDLTTIRIAERLNMSVGTIYHYYPNKHAILFALGLRWLDAIGTALDSVDKLQIEQLGLTGFVDASTECLLSAYKNQRAILPLAQALWSIPELRELDRLHDERVIARMLLWFRRLGFRASDNELNRLARAWLEVSHALLLVIVNQRTLRASRSAADLKRVTLALLEPHLADDQGATAAVEPP